MSSGKKPRGSDLLAQRWTKQDLARLVDIEHDGVNLVEFFPKGIPDPDGGWGTWHVKPDALLKFLGTLLNHDKIPGVWVFPKGLPPVIEGFDVGFQAGSARER
ncbi:hypothetical protein CI1B_73870 [Bradyrhizobium ivorense]|uniref:Uncharacterized protein n=1 Tax=Bradyrhizobium ivorense TaxID=2511166 RepID=A0A508TVF2_9BRAD|nr:hypothetical protein [Bradyrhizobium ivorense]MCC8937760.1 hypothetical protein [Bradyrhizobium ivorense]VIO78359.1 hypothetical protein CI1B_73870 [Bradyrhizobium ivorense]VIO78746.1 hypothetical protein CI41S_65910 [Bradyrhizobium ivorense]